MNLTNFKFDGQNSKLITENKNRHFEFVATFFYGNDSDKVKFLENYLDEDALSWFMNNIEIGHIWESMKHSFISRYGFEITEHILKSEVWTKNKKQGILWKERVEVLPQEVPICAPISDTPVLAIF